MPELPEVEVTRRRIEPLLLGRKIARVITSEPSYFYLTPPDQIRRALEGQQFSALERRGTVRFGRVRMKPGKPTTFATVLPPTRIPPPVMGADLVKALIEAKVDVNLAVTPEEETGAHTIRGQAFSPDGGTLEFSGGGVWRSSGPNQRILKHITQLANGQRTFAVDNFDLVKNTASGTVYALD